MNLQANCAKILFFNVWFLLNGWNGWKKYKKKQGLNTNNPCLFFFFLELCFTSDKTSLQINMRFTYSTPGGLVYSSTFKCLQILNSLVKMLIYEAEN